MRIATVHRIMRFKAALACLPLLLVVSNAHAQQDAQERAPRWNMGMMVSGICMTATGSVALHAGLLVGLQGLGKAGHGGGDEAGTGAVIMLAATSVMNAGIVLWILGGRPDERRRAQLELAPGGAALRVELP